MSPRQTQNTGGRVAVTAAHCSWPRAVLTPSVDLGHAARSRPPADTDTGRGQ